MEVKGFCASRTLRLSVIMLAFIFLVFGCGAGGESSSADSGPGDTGAIRARLVWQHSAVEGASVRAMQSPSGDVCTDYEIDTIDVTVEDAFSNLVASVSWRCSSHQGIIAAVPAGTDYSVTFVGTTLAGSGDWETQVTGVTVVKDQTEDVGELEMIYIGDDDTPPTIEDHFPDSGATGIALNPEITITFSEKVVAASITTACSLIETDSMNPVDFTIANDDASHTATLSPNDSLLSSTGYTVVINTDIEDLARLNMVSGHSWNFTTVDLTAPETIITAGPGGGALATGSASFTFTGTDDVTLTDGLVYATYLEGHDSEWSSFDAATVKYYTNLPNGFYTFQVKARDAAGNEDPAPDTVSFMVGVSTLAAGWNHSLRVGGGGSLWAWGANGSGQLGDSTTTDRHEPIRVGSAADWAYVTAGGDHSLGVKTDGSLWAWGNNFYSELGDGTTTDRHEPVRVGSDTDWAYVSAGFSHSLGVKTDGSLWAWGQNLFGQLGDGTSSNRREPIRVGSAADWAYVTAGSDHSLGIKTDGSLWAWGDNGSGQLGDGTTTGRHEPIRVGSDAEWKAVEAGEEFTVGIKSDGSLWAWGENFSGQLGLGDDDDRFTPTQVGGDTDWEVVQAGGYRNTRALKSDGSLWNWGAVRYTTGFVYINRVPSRVGGDTDWGAVQAGGFHTLALKSDGSLWAWGRNSSGQLGLGDTEIRDVPTLVVVGEGQPGEGG